MQCATVCNKRTCQPTVLPFSVPTVTISSFSSLIADDPDYIPTILVFRKCKYIGTAKFASLSYIVFFCSAKFSSQVRFFKYCHTLRFIVFIRVPLTSKHNVYMTVCKEANLAVPSVFVVAENKYTRDIVSITSV